jgi:hypothetical protein
MKCKISREQIVADILQHCSANNLTTAELGIRALKDSGFFTRLKSGTSVGLERIERLYAYMEKTAAGDVHDILD